MAKNRERANKGRIVRKMNKDEYVLFDHSVRIREAINKKGLVHPTGNSDVCPKDQVSI